MKKILNYVTSVLLGMTLITSSCTNLDENIYDSLSPSNLTGSDEETQDILGNLYVQLRFMYWRYADSESRMPDTNISLLPVSGFSIIQ